MFLGFSWGPWDVGIHELIDALAVIAALLAALIALRASHRADRIAAIGNSIATVGNSLAAVNNTINEQMVKVSSELNAISKRLNEITMAQVELEMRLAVDGSGGRADDLSLEIIKTTFGKPEQEVKAVMEGLGFCQRSALEKYLNAYETCCASYLDGKVDPERFKRNFWREIQTLGKASGTLKELLGESPQRSPYKCIWKVHEEWFNLERTDNRAK